MPLRRAILDANILIVDDHRANVELLEGLLAQTGYQRITSTMDPREVVALHRANHYDLILLDLVMPVMDGFQVMDELKAIETNGYVPILVVTAHPDHKLRALASGAKDFVSKPFDLVEVTTRIHNMLEVRLLYKQLEQHNKTLKVFAMHDSLTGLPNRRLLMDRLALAIAHAHRNDGAMAVMYLDLDGFKQVNDSSGHDAGDMLLSMVSERLTHSVRQEDTVARVGGDEFVILLSELSDAQGAAKLASKVVANVSRPYSIRGQTMSITASIGVAIYPDHGIEGEDLIRNADRALFEAKGHGKNRYCIARDAIMNITRTPMNAVVV